MIRPPYLEHTISLHASLCFGHAKFHSVLNYLRNHVFLFLGFANAVSSTWNTSILSPFHLICSLTLSSEFTFSRNPSLTYKSLIPTSFYSMQYFFSSSSLSLEGLSPSLHKVNFTFAKFGSNATPYEAFPNPYWWTLIISLNPQHGIYFILLILLLHTFSPPLADILQKSPDICPHTVLRT